MPFDPSILKKKKDTKPVDFKKEGAAFALKSMSPKEAEAPKKNSPEAMVELEVKLQSAKKKNK